MPSLIRRAAPRSLSASSRSGRGSLAVLAALLAWTARASVTLVEREEEEVFLLAVRLDHEVLAESVPAYPVAGGVLLPLGELSRLLGFAIRTDSGRGIAEGFFISEARTFQLTLERPSLRIAGKEVPLRAGEVEAHADDLYVHSGVLSRWFPLTVTVDLRSATLRISAREQLPLQRQRLRHAQLQRTLSHQQAASPAYPTAPLASALFDGPFIDQTLRLVVAGEPAVPPVQFTTRAAAELLYLDASAFLNGSTAGLTDARFTLGRRDPRGGLLGPLRATEVAAGDVFFPGVELIAHPQAGVGAVVSNFPLEQASEFDRHAFRGDLPPGWEVELYRNEALLGFHPPREDGRYEFLDVPLVFGVNVFRLVFYGPHGQRREQVETFNISDRLTPPGTIRYRLAANQPQYAGRRALGELEVGLMRNLSLSASATLLEVSGELRAYGKAGLRGFWRSLVASADVATELGGGFAAAGAVRSRLGPVGISAEHLAVFGGFRSERLMGAAGPLSSRSALRLDGIAPFPLIQALPFYLQYQLDRAHDGAAAHSVSGRLSGSHRGVAVANELSWIFGAVAPSATGVVMATRYFRGPALSLRAQVEYELLPRPEVSGFSVATDGRLLPGYFFSATAGRVRGGNRFGVGVGKNQGVFSLSLNAEYSAVGGASVALTLSVGASRDRRTGAWHLQGQSVTQSGAVSARAFLDANGNGRFDEGEEPLPGAQFAVNRALSSELADDDGTAFVTQVPAHREATLTLVPGSLEDPFWHPAKPGFRFVPRPGKVLVVDYPVEMRGEIAGTLYLRSQGRQRGIGGVELELLTVDGTVVQTVRSAYDGFYLFGDVRPGRYLVRPKAGDAGALAFRQVAVDASGAFVDGVDFALERQGQRLVQIRLP